MHTRETWKIAQKMYEMGREPEIIAERTGIAKSTLLSKASTNEWEKPTKLTLDVSTSIQDLAYCVGKWSHFLTFLGVLQEGESDELIALLKYIEDIDKLTNSIQRAVRAREGLLNQEHALPHITLVEWAMVFETVIKEQFAGRDTITVGEFQRMLTELKASNKDALEKL